MRISGTFFLPVGHLKKSLLVLALIGSVAACGKKKTSTSENPQTAVSGQLAISLTAANAKTGANSLNLQSGNFAPTAAQPSSIASGAADSFELSLLSMDLEGKDDKGNPVNVNIFKSEAGKPISITGSEIDLSQLFTKYECYIKDGTPLTLATGETCKCGLDKDDKVIAPQADGSCKKTDANGQLLEISEPSGLLSVGALKYTALNVTFAPKAKIKGCVSATFRDDPGNRSNNSVGSQTYCTQTALSTTNETITPRHADYKTGSAQETEIYLSKGWDSRNMNMGLRFPIKDGLEVKEGQKANLTLVIDVNRMLRFYNMGRTDQGPNPGFPTNRAYFFTTVFEDSLFVFAGKPGAIRGYSWQTETCVEEFQNSYSCTGNSTSVDGWITLILDSSGTPFAANIMPDDDNNLTTLKGSNRRAEIGIDNALISKTTDGKFDVSVSLQGEVNPTIKSFDLSGSVGSSFTTNYRGLRGNFTGSPKDSFGTIKLTRGL